MRFIGNLLRIYSYIFEAVLCLLAIAMSIVIFASPSNSLNMGWLPWSGADLPKWLLCLGVLGLVAVFLAASRKFRLLHFLFAVSALVILVKGLFLGGWNFHGEDDFHNAVHLALAAFVAALGSIPLGGGNRTRP